MKKIHFWGRRIGYKLAGFFKDRNWKSNYFKQGSYSSGMTVLMLGVVVAANLIVNEIPAQYTKIDASANQLYSVGDITREVLKGLDKDVTLYLICESGAEDQTVLELLEQYEGLSGHIKVETKDPVITPGFVSQYSDTDLANNSIIAECGRQSAVISYEDIYSYEMNYSSYSYETTGFDGEGQITSAIDMVISGQQPKLYTLEGHGEKEIDEGITKAIEKQNIQVETLNLLTEEAIPDDIDCLLIHAPTSDITEGEAALIEEYLQGQGNIFITTAYSEEEMPRLEGILESYGVTTVPGIIVEGNAGNYFQGYPTYLLPDIQSNNVTSSLVAEKRYVLMPAAQGIELDEENEYLVFDSILKTSEQAYSKTDVMNTETYEKEAGDIDGPFEVAAAVTKVLNEEELLQSKLVYFTSESILYDQVDEAVSGGNSTLVSNLLAWLCGQETTISIQPKSLESETVILTSAQAGRIGFGVTVGIPVVLLISGGIVWIWRKRK